MVNREQTKAKVLVVYAHPDPQHSVANQVMMEKIADLEHVSIIDLYATYPNFFIDVHAEQQRLREHDVLVLQHPLYVFLPCSFKRVDRSRVEQRFRLR